METPKYYTPTIEEFHVGFEYEVLDLADDMKGITWRKQTFEGEEIRTYFTEELERGEMRVKYLDLEDIVSLGWINKKEGLYYFEKNNYADLEILVNPSIHNIGIDAGDQYFRGVIKNKSELKKLMQQLKIS